VIELPEPPVPDARFVSRSGSAPLHLTWFVPIVPGVIGLTVAIASARGPSQLSALVQETQNEVVVETVVVKEFPVCRTVPPVDAEYQLYVPPVQPVALKVMDPGPQVEASTGVGAGGIAYTVAVTGTLADLHPRIECLASTQ
jgi:hypothetical protein